ncbi:MAG: FAD-dependent oxidoreductase [Pseudomonadota bacterium]
MNAPATDPIFLPLHLKGLVLRNRIMSTAHACGLGDEEMMPGETYQAYHVEKARGGLALTMFGGSSFVAGDSMWSSGQLDISTDRIIPYLRQFSDRVHAEGAAIMIQITHLGRRAETNTKNWMPAMAPSPVREIGHRAIPREMDRSDIDRVVREMGEAALRAKEGGLDGLETMTHGHLIGQFFSPVTNRRTDGFGGALENRCRFGLMVHEEIRRQVGDDYIVGMRMGIDESAVGGSGFEESLEIARMFESAGLIDFVNANYGRIDTELALATECMPGMSVPNAPWMDRAGAFKQEIGLPVFHAAKIADVATARHAIRAGLLDMVAMTRAHIADPHIVAKLRRGEEARIRPCIGASHCMSENRPTCVHNAASGRERFWQHEVAPTDGPRRRVAIVGGGPAGLEAARVAATRGHSVVLFEAQDRLGGQLRLAGTAGWRRDLQSIVDWREGELSALGVDVRMNCLAEVADIEIEDPDVVIVATGGLPGDGWIEGAELCTDPWDVLSGAARPTGRVLIFDGTGRHVAPSVAATLDPASELTYAMIDEVVAKELAYAERVVWRKEFAQRGITPLLEHRLERVLRDGNALRAHLVNELTGERLEVATDAVIADHGCLPVDNLWHEMRERSANDGRTDPEALVAGRPQPGLDGSGPALFRIGDAVSSRNLPAAIFDALRLCSPL